MTRVVKRKAEGQAVKLLRQSHESNEELSKQQAVALVYNDTSGAPKVIGKGKGLVAREIIRRAKESNVFVHESPELVALLMEIDLDAEIPPQLYEVVAEMLAWIYAMEREST